MHKKRISSLAGMVALLLVVAACGRSAPEEGAATLEASAGSSTTGPTITTPVTQPVTTQPPTTTTPTYVIQQGDSLSLIAERFGVTTKALADFNGIADANAIKVGQTLTIPPVTATTSG